MMNVMTKQTLFDEINLHLLTDDSPSEYLTRISKEPSFKEHPFHLLLKLQKTEQSKKYHPEGSVWNHTMMVVDEAAKVRERSKDVKALMWAALLHDIGKPDTTRNRKGKITSYDHDTVGANITNDFLQEFTDDDKFIQTVSNLVRYHMHMLYVLKGLPFGNSKAMVRDVDIHEIGLLCRSDRMGRTGVDREAVEEEYQQFLDKVRAL